MPDLTYPVKPAKEKPKEKPTKEKKGPYTLPCGCNALGKCCPEEERLGEYLDQCRASFSAKYRCPKCAWY